jgi:rod shape determining protein RodA
LLNRIETWQVQSKEGLMSQIHIDLPLMIAVLLASTVSAIAIFSASNSSEAFLTSHLIRIGLSILAMIMAAQFSPLFYSRVAPWLYAICLVLLIAVFFFGETRNNATRWIHIGISFQPSEFLKIAMPLVVAKYIASGSIPLNNTNIMASLVLVFLPTALIFKQPDLGTSILIAFSGLVIVFLSGIKKRYLFSAIILFLGCLPFIWKTIHPFQQQRVLTFLDPEKDPLGAGYHIIQSKIAIGSGGLFGKGWLNGTQGQLDFLPERTTDFIFSILAEEFGLVGVLLIILIYLFIVGRGLLIAINSDDLFSRLAASSISLTFFIYVFVNIGMTTGLLPVVGVPLPLISKGGTSSFTLMASLGILMSLHTHKRLIPR